MDHTLKSEDTILSHLIPYIIHGWPDEKSELPFDLTAYWNFKSELIRVDGVICKGNKVLIPTVLLARMVEKTHSSQLVFENSIPIASDTLF
ncbi:hypothetical protein LSH36_1827g00004 [Paralvinella palmiformis]|jgi:hypothetical protein|uniref:Uncharacterized protein n=1 Tax=Paralvinella palmiformis TaxID=53620 RepID=A0AAD9IR25_9ANNE|nr:hypothetical protein LSH36_1827g00004 [Paralvinella palmiformis]